MVTATILMIFCVKESTPADTGAAVHHAYGWNA